MMNRDFNYTYAQQERSVGLGLKLAIFFMPAFFVWLLLGKGYSPRARAIGFGWLIALCGFVFMTSEDIPESSTNAVTVETPATQAVSETPIQVDVQETKRLAAEKAFQELLDVKLPPNGDYREHNVQMTIAYHKWAEAEEAYRGPNWNVSTTLNSDYMDCLATARAKGLKGAGIIGSLTDGDSPADAACRALGYTKYVQAPTLESLLLKPPMVPSAEYRTSSHVRTQPETVTPQENIASQAQVDEPSEVVIYQSEY
ncbi:MAG: hypothetical protein QM645_02670 [Asticcacaulis sp.]